MKYIINAKGTTATESVKEYIEKRFAKFDRFLSDDQKIQVMVQVKDGGNRHKVEVTIPLKKGIVRAEENDRDLYLAIDKVDDKLERILRRRKEKDHDRYTKTPAEVYVPTEVPVEEEAIVISKVKHFHLEPMSPEEAAEAMEMVSHPFYLFRHIETGDVCVVYKREDGTYGLLKEE